MKKLIFVILPILLIGCSSGYHLRRAIKKDPSILTMDTLVHDTVLTVITERVEKDSTFIYSSDTITIIKENLLVKHFYNKETDSVYIFALCDNDTIKIPYEVRIPYEKITYNKSWTPPNWVIGLLVALLIVYGGKKLLDRLI